MPSSIQVIWLRCTCFRPYRSSLWSGKLFQQKSAQIDRDFIYGFNKYRIKLATWYIDLKDDSSAASRKILYWQSL